MVSKGHTKVFSRVELEVVIIRKNVNIINMIMVAK